jgi:hypothetical protein
MAILTALMLLVVVVVIAKHLYNHIYTYKRIKISLHIPQPSLGKYHTDTDFLEAGMFDINFKVNFAE